MWPLRRLTIIGMGGLAALAAVLILRGAWPGTIQAPRLILPETQHDFGVNFEDRRLSHAFVIENRGLSPLKILKVKPACACTVASYDRSIAPGGQGEITLTIKPFSVFRQFRKATLVWINDPEHPKFSLVLTGVAKPFIDIRPRLVLFRGAPDGDLRGQVRFTPQVPGPFKISDFHTNIPDKIDLSLKAEKPGRVYVLKVKNKCRQPGRYLGFIELRTTCKERPRILVRVIGLIYPQAMVKRSRLPEQKLSGISFRPRNAKTIY
jgi:hypothetical protein